MIKSVFFPVTYCRFPKLSEYFVSVLVKNTLSAAVVVWSFLCLSEILDSPFEALTFNHIFIGDFKMPHKDILFARRDTDKLWKYDTETQKWTQDTHYENSRADCKIFSLP